MYVDLNQGKTYQLESHSPYAGLEIYSIVRKLQPEVDKRLYGLILFAIICT